jgi:Tol biopolymer transport system component
LTQLSALSPGTRLGIYEITAAIGAGGMGEVYRAKDTKLGRDVAIKVLPAAFAQDPERLARFEREARVLASLNHTNIAHVYGFESATLPGGSIAHFLAMEMVEGEDLAERLKRGAIPVDEALGIARQIADGLEEAHEKGIVHRDLKPANIKLAPDAKVKVLDFGLAKAYAADPSGSGSPELSHSPTMTRQGTEAGMIMGTAAYMSPEQARGKTVDKRADIWAFGVVLYEMLTGTRLFKGETVSDTLAAVLMRDPDLSLLPPRLRGLVGRCLDRDPRKRLRDIGDLWLLLESSKPSATAGSDAPRRWIWAWALGALILGSAATWALIGSTGRADATLPLVMVEPPPPGTRFVGAPLLSPDGRRLAMIAVDTAGTTRLWTRDLAEATPHAVEGSEGANTAYGVMGPFWSPDSRQIAFLAQGQVRRAAPGGGAATLVAAASPRSGVWLKDGDLLLAIPDQGLMRVPATGGSPRPASGFTTDAFRSLQIDGLDVSPDGRTLLFTQFGGETGVYAARLDGTGKRLLFPGEQSYAMFAGPDLIVRPDANVLVAQRFNAADMSLVGEAFPVAPNVGPDDYAGSANGGLSYISGVARMSRLTWFTRDGKVTGPAGPEGNYTEVAISRGGRYLGFSRADAADGNTDVWLQAIAGGAPSRLTSDPDVDHLFAISHDERDVVWEAHAKGSLNVMRRPADGSSPPQLVRMWGKAGGPSDWSPDGRFILYHSDDGAGGRKLWIVPSAGPGDPVQVTPAEFGATEGQFSPDGRFVAMVASATGGPEVYVQHVESMKLVGGPVRVSESGGGWPQWRRDGGELYFLHRGAIMAAEFHPGSDRLFSTPRTLFTIAGAADRPRYRNYAPTPDGQRFVAIVTAGDATPHPATVILNWRASLAEKR